MCPPAEKHNCVTIQDGGRSGRKICVKLACKRIFLPDLTSEESPMLLVRLCRTRRCPVLNCYKISSTALLNSAVAFLISSAPKIPDTTAAPAMPVPFS